MLADCSRATRPSLFSIEHVTKCDAQSVLTVDREYDARKMVKRCSMETVDVDQTCPNVVFLRADKCRREGGHPQSELSRESGVFAGTTLAVQLDMRPTPRLILLVFLLLQIFDGVLTYTAVTVLGVIGEGNMLLAAAMQIVGAGPTLLGAKTLAAGCGVLLYVRGFYGILGALTGFYAFVAITPWLMVFHSL
jgi:hypothetical protein